MQRTVSSLILAVAVAAVVALSISPVGAQNAGKNAPKADAKAKAAPAGGGGAYPQRPPAAPAIVARGQKLFDAECGACHGEDARGGDMGSNLIRSQIILNDDNGERLAPVLRGQGVEGTMMPKYNFSEAQTADLAAFLHSFRVNGYDGSRMRPDTIVVGNAQAGQAFFTQRCGSCHSATGDLRGIATRITDARTLQQRWLNPSGGGRGVTVRPATVAVTIAGGERIQGTLVRVDDFLVTLTLADGRQRTIRRDGDVPKVEVNDPYQPHKALLPVYTDKNIHDVTAYLVTLK